jgi:wyosine [tRNA(Phe)-imidazoG37] synthetase (radical SAM superfamily)
VIAFGPVPSRRLGRSLGVNNLRSPKRCTYSCTYCQVGLTPRTQLRPAACHTPDAIVGDVARRVACCRAAGERIDYVTFLPNGEPTLDTHLGEEIGALKPLGIPVAVITNGSLLWRPEVRARLAAADLVSVKVDAVHSAAWRRVNRPAQRLDLRSVLRGILDFACEYGGALISETMLLSGFNDDAASVEGVADFLAQVRPSRAYLAVPTRPPADPEACAPAADAVVRAHEILSERLPCVALLAEEDDAPFGHTGTPADDLMGILLVHPMRERAVREYLEQVHAGWGVARDLLASGRVAVVEYRGERFLTRHHRRQPDA